MNNLELINHLNKFKDKTLEIISVLEKDDEYILDNLDSLFRERQSIIDKIDTLETVQDEFKLIASELNLSFQEERLNSILEEKRKTLKDEVLQVKKDITKMKNQRLLNKKYVNMNPIDPVFLSKKF
ncbi:hypothetical protein [Clostridium cylindrosporum]|uniref:Flagellar protein FliT n=1 Tax=Clostridium cylindrosporum DSM 605 TaxID=1121307 RepID=A0A0J8D728_CLOCY|nr:hypothetical protein [Clostridium cylindrosporum]KMT21692.1 hypothetical protein CLCY_2c04540 [Clostridium cylindrosporum DSM 605]